MTRMEKFNKIRCLKNKFKLLKKQLKAAKSNKSHSVRDIQAEMHEVSQLILSIRNITPNKVK